jgi:hypothetical protein
MNDHHDTPERILSQVRLILGSLAGGLAGYLGEVVHHWAGVWAMPGTSGQPPWIFAVYAAVLYVAGWCFFAVERRLAFPLAPTLRAYLIEGAGMVVLFLGVAAAYRHETALALVLLAWLGVRLVRFRARGDLVLAVFTAGLDYALESGLAAAGLYEYRVAAWTVLPLWLAPFWACMGLGLRRLYVLTTVTSATT